MKRVFVFCIGGTGIRVMKSITMLMASGMKTNGYTVVPIVIDPHLDLEEKRNLHTLLDEYITIFNQSVTNGEQKLNPLEGFFNSPMEKLKDIAHLLNDTEESQAFQQSFSNYLNASKIREDDPNKFLLETLFSQKNLDQTLSVGFKGNPNIGTVILGDYIKNTDWYSSLKTLFQEGDRIFIISSIFGGTGASGYPLIEKCVREADSHPAIKEAIMGAVTVLPYYQLQKMETTMSDIDSTTFLSKTKSALTYYENNVKSDFLYYVGEKRINQTYENDESRQDNKAHFIELVAATALFDFLSKERATTPQYLSRGIKEDVFSLDLSSLGAAYSNIVKVIADFSLLNKLLKILPQEKYFPLKQTRGLDKKFYNNQEFNDLEKFSSRFMGWYKELANNKRAFAPLNHDKDDVETWIKGHPLEAKDESYLLLEMIKASNREEQENHNNKMRYLLKFAYKAIDFYTNNNKLASNE